MLKYNNVNVQFKIDEIDAAISSKDDCDEFRKKT